MQLCQQELGKSRSKKKKTRERKEGKGMKGDKRRSGKEMRVLMLARLFLQPLGFLPDVLYVCLF